MCPAGWTGAQCTERQKRPCTNRHRDRKDMIGIVISHIDPVTKEDLNWTVPGIYFPAYHGCINAKDNKIGVAKAFHIHHSLGWTASRCAGYCDDDIGHCYCGHGSKYSHIPAPLGSSPGG